MTSVRTNSKGLVTIQLFWNLLCSVDNGTPQYKQIPFRGWAGNHYALVQSKKFHRKWLYIVRLADEAWVGAVQDVVKGQDLICQLDSFHDSIVDLDASALQNRIREMV